MLVGTVVDMWQHTNPFPPLSKQNDDTLILKILKAFSIYTNGIKSQSSIGPKPDSRMAPIIAGSGLLEPIIENFLNISFNGPAEDIVSQLFKCIQISKVLTFI